jgi:transcriptional regulator with XRE-family HTH domain
VSENEFGEYLNHLRRKKMLTLSMLSEQSDVSHSYLSQVENGKKPAPSPEILAKLAGPLGVTQTELMLIAGYLKDDFMDFMLKLTIADIDFDMSDEVNSGTGPVIPGKMLIEMLDNPSGKSQLFQIVLDRVRELNALARTELTEVIAQENLTYRGVLLNDQEQKRILDMLKVLFPER